MQKISQPDPVNNLLLIIDHLSMVSAIVSLGITNISHIVLNEITINISFGLWKLSTQHTFNL